MISTLNSAQTGLFTSQLGIENVSNNIANENTPGYTKRVISQNELENIGTTYANGVGINSLDRQVNKYMALQIQGESTIQSYYSKSDSIYESLEVSFLETESSGLSYSLDNYFQSIENLRSNPNSEVYKSELSSSANDLIYNMQNIYNDIEDIQNSLKDEMHSQVKNVNTLTNEIANLNTEIAQSPNSLDLLDRRDLLINELSTYGDIEVIEEQSYYQIKMSGETVVFNNISNELNVVEDYTSQKNVYDTNLLKDSNITSGETISLTLNNGETVSIIADTTGIDDTDVSSQLVNEINSNPLFNESLEASLDNDGNLVVKSKTEGEEAFFDLEIQLVDSKIQIIENETLSQVASDDIHLELLDKRLDLNSGSLKAIDENTSTLNPNNVLYQTQKDLNNLAYSLIDLNESYVEEDSSYIYGDDESKSYLGTSNMNNTNLFNGSSVMTMDFNEKSIDDLSQNDLDYLASLQFKEDINIDSSNPNSSQSFSSHLIDIKVEVSSLKENMGFKLETQNSIVISLQNSYDLISKVDSDEEMINLMEFQAAYEANAKVITAVDEMLQTILNM